MMTMIIVVIVVVIVVIVNYRNYLRRTYNCSLYIMVGENRR